MGSVNSRCSSVLIIEVVVRIAIQNQVAAAGFVLDTRVAVAVGVNAFYYAVISIIDNSVLAGISDCEIQKMDILSTFVYRDTSVAISLTSEVENRPFARI